MGSLQGSYEMDASHKPGMHGNRRQSVRVPANLAIQFSIINGDGEEDKRPKLGNVIDLSQGGVQFRCKTTTWEGAIILFSILGINAEPVISGSAKILHSQLTNDETIARASFLETVLHKAA